MVRGSRVLLLKDGGGGGGNALFKVLSDILVCPLSKQPLRHCPDSRSLVSDAVGVSFPVIPCLAGAEESEIASAENPLVAKLSPLPKSCRSFRPDLGFCTSRGCRMIINGIPCLVPKDGKLLEDEIKLKPWNNPAICNVDPPLSSIGLAQVYACLWTQHLMDFDSLESNALRTIDFRYQARPTTENPVRHIPNRIAAFRI
ncbi:hypothetical protein MUK42_20249 [Musa troglodytarum]|uniref:Protein preY, mitochondrial n=1 Tax=Musa troglodytarum TaxID=320322 RepID=A0A9E7FW14_9LILI|nr:hypothetical protein MUK42_20249 [Musa troglodytarum]